MQLLDSTRINKNSTNLIFGLLSFALPLLIYTLTAARTITGYADSAELTSAAYNLDAAHPPGYPLFILLGKLFTLIPIGSIAFRVNFFSAATASLTIFVIYNIFKKFKLSSLSSFLASLVITVSYSFWLYAITAEVYSLNNLIAATIIYLALVWAEKTANQEKGAEKTLFTLAFVVGLGLSNHLSILALGPGILYLIWAVDKKTIFANLLKLILFLLLGLTPYLFLLYAASKTHYPLFGLILDPSRIWAFITRADYGGFLSAGPSSSGNWEGILNLSSYHLKLLATRLTPLAPLLALYFIFVSLVRRQREFISLSIILLTTALLFPLSAMRAAVAADFHSQGVIERFSLLGQVALGIVFLPTLYSLIAQRLPARKELVFQGATFLLALTLFILNYPHVNKASYAMAKNYALNILNQVEPNSIIFTSDDMTIFSLLYFVNTERIKPGITLVNTNFLENVYYLKELKNYDPSLYQTESKYSYDVARDIIAQNQDKRPVYFVMLKDPYPLGFDANPNFLTPMGLILKADTSASPRTLEKNSLKDYWGGYDLSGLEKEYKDPFAKLAQYNYPFRAQVNAKVYLNAGCLNCIQNDIAALASLSQDKGKVKEVLASLTLPEPRTPKKTAQDFLYSAKGNLAKDTGTDPFYFHRAVWDLEQALALDPGNQEARAFLTNLMNSVGL